MYCLKCKKQFEPVNPEDVTMKNGRKARKAKCTTCGTVAFQILKQEKPPLQTT